MKRIYCLLICAVMVGVLCSPTAHAVTTGASCAILMDGDSGRILYAQNIHQPRLIASITKLMTALVGAEQGSDLEQEVTILPEWVGSEGSSIYLQAGEKITLKGLLYGLLLQSGNDAAMAIACHVAGDMESFVSLMNERAGRLGMEHTRFANPSGLNDENHYSTAYDMALLARACLENPTVAEICATQSVTVGTRTFYNHNKLLYRYEGCVGMKTGYTELAGRTLVSAARRNGQTLVCVTLNDGNDWNDHEKLFNYGFSTYPAAVLCQSGQTFGMVPVTGSLLPAVTAVAEGGASFPLTEGESLEMAMELVGCVQAPVVQGAVLGYASWCLDGREVARVQLICEKSAPSDLWQGESLGQRISRWLGRPTPAVGFGAQMIERRKDHGGTAAKITLCRRAVLPPQGGGVAGGRASHSERSPGLSG